MEEAMTDIATAEDYAAARSRLVIRRQQAAGQLNWDREQDAVLLTSEPGTRRRKTRFDKTPSATWQGPPSAEHPQSATAAYVDPYGQDNVQPFGRKSHPGGAMSLAGYLKGSA